MIQPKPMTFGSLFAGIGGLDLGLERAGMKCLWQVEWDEYCQKILAKHWPDVKRYGDVKETHSKENCPLADPTSDRGKARATDTQSGEEGYTGKLDNSGPDNGCPNCLTTVDLICGGFPCQPVSVAGARKGDADERWLWPEFYRIICELRPRWVLAENVPGLLSIDSGRLFAGILRDLAESGYDAEWDCIPAAAFGAPHLRYRVFIVAHASKCEDRGVFEPQLSANIGASSQDVADTTDRSTQRSCPQSNERELEEGIFGTSWYPNDWAVEPDVGRVAHGVPSRVDRLRTLGNTVVPQLAEWIGRRIIENDVSQA